MLELIAALTSIALFLLAFWIITNSDDENSGGGLMEPALIPIRSNERDL